MNVGDLIRRQARWTPDKIAVVWGMERISYGVLHAGSDRLLAALHVHRIAKGDRIATLADNCARYLEIVAAAAKGGLIVVPINPRLTPPEVRFILQNSGAVALFATTDLRDMIAPILPECPAIRLLCLLDRADGPASWGGLLAEATGPAPTPEVTPEDGLFISYTSGTTGAPKGALMTHRNLLTNAANVALHFEMNPSTVSLVVMPLSTGGANHHIVVPTLFVGGRFVIHDARHFRPDGFLATIEAERVTNVQLVPTMIYRLLDFPELGNYDLSSLRTIGYGSAPMATERLREALERIGSKFCQTLGQTESSSLSICLSKQDHIDAVASNDLGVLGSCGRPINGVDVRIIDDDDNDVAVGTMGELAFRGDTVTQGYWNAPEATAAALRGGWLHTGDMAREDARGFITLVDRKKDIIISGGLNVSAREVEEVIYRHPGVRECAVIAVPHEQWGETVKAILSVRDGRQVAVEEIVELCRANLASYKRPTSIEFIDEFPKSSMGKILKRDLKLRYWGNRERLVN